MRQSITPTYDSRETGDRFNVSAIVNGKPVCFLKPIPDPFVRQVVYIGWRDLLRGLLKRKLVVEVSVGGDHDIVEDVMELDANYLGYSNCTRRTEFNRGLHKAMKRMVKEEEAAENDQEGDL
jgi:hypothetical protein